MKLRNKTSWINFPSIIMVSIFFSFFNECFINSYTENAGQTFFFFLSCENVLQIVNTVEPR